MENCLNIHPGKVFIDQLFADDEAQEEQPFTLKEQRSTLDNVLAAIIRTPYA